MTSSPGHDDDAHVPVLINRSFTENQLNSHLRQIPYLGPIRSVLAVALIQTPHRFRTKRQLWAYSGLALETRISAEYRLVEGQVRRSKHLLPFGAWTKTTTMI
jgi:transposase